MLSADDLANCQQAVDAVKAAADLADEKAASASGSWFTSLLGADSTASAMKADAAATRNGANVMAAKLDRWRLDSATPTHDDAVAFIQACGEFADVSQLLAAEKMLSASNAAVTVAADTAHDVVKDVAAGATAGAAIYGTVALLGLGGFALFSFVKRKAGK